MFYYFTGLQQKIIVTISRNGVLSVNFISPCVLWYARWIVKILGLDFPCLTVSSLNWCIVIITSNNNNNTFVWRRKCLFLLKLDTISDDTVKCIILKKDTWETRNWSQASAIATKWSGNFHVDPCHNLLHTTNYPRKLPIWHAIQSWSRKFYFTLTVYQL